MAVVNQKGGVGKTTTAINLSASLAELDQRVLLIDMDPQGNASTGLGVPRDNRSKSSYHVLTETMPLDEAIRPTRVRGLYILPSHPDLAAAEMEIGSSEGRTRILSQAVEAAESGFDYVLIDCPPSLNLLTLNALAVARSIIVPLQCEFFALEGLSQLLKTVEMAKAGINTKLAIDGVVLTMYDKRNRLSAQVADDVRRHLGRAVFDTVIPRNVRIAEAPSFAEPVTTYEPASQGAKAYRRLAREILRKHAARKK
ncbi:ParA family protein [uncultured Algimonas sp.]|uniref:ParA family protein n=1 Tax=uncultured Algimonas sp. TaxID=1547920 RepID=UPI00344E96F1